MPFFLLRQAGFPQYLHEPTRQNVLRLFRNILTQINRLPDPLARRHLNKYASHRFSAYKYVTDPRRIAALCTFAQAELDLLTSANQGDVKDLEKVLERVFSRVRVKQSPLRTLIPIDEPEINKSLLAYKFNNLQMPGTRTFDQHKAAMANLNEGSHMFYRFIQFLSKNKLTSGVNGRKLFLNPRIQYTVLGDLPVARRQRNLLKRAYHMILRDALRPVHPTTIEHMEEQLKKPDLPRLYRRRLVQCARRLYSVDEQGKIIKCDIPF